MTTVIDIVYSQIYKRLQEELPPWFGNQQFVAPPPPNTTTPTTNFNNVMWAYLITAFESYYQLKYDFLQLRIGQYEISNPDSAQPIATGDNLDLIAQDFFGSALVRKVYETDDTFRHRILSNVLRAKATRPAMYNALVNLVIPAFEQAGIPIVYPVIYEPWNPVDNGGYNIYQALAYNTIGAYGNGDASSAYTCYITVYLPHAIGLATYPGYETQGSTPTYPSGLSTDGLTGSNIPPMWFGSESLLTYYITYADVLQLIEYTKVLGTICYLTLVYV